ncbi:MAG: pepsin/retropepsin-like aspartic protease family protein [Ferruginibacter sp.]
MRRRSFYINCLVILLLLHACEISTAAPKFNPPFLKNISIQFYPSSSSIDSTSCTLPFTRAGNLILIKARVDTMEGNFILDTGAPYLVLNITYFRDYPITGGDHEQTSITGVGATVDKTIISQLSFGSLEYSRTPADLINLGHLEKSKGVKILGLLGVDLFMQCEMIVDYEKSLIYLHRIARKESSTYRHAMLQDTAAYNTFPFSMKENRIIATTEIGGKKLKFVIDHGAESNILDSRLPNKVFENVTITGHINILGSENKKVDALYGDLQHMMIGNKEIGSLPVMVVNLEYTCFSSVGCVDGVLGFDFLSLHKIGFNFVNRKMYIWK